MTPTIRPYRASDRAACARVFFRAVRDGAADWYTDAQRTAWAPSGQIDPDRPDKLLNQWCWVAQDGQGIIGFMSLQKDGHLDMAFVLPEHMGTGVAAALHTSLVAHARTTKLTHLTVDASHLARRFFAKHGWRMEYEEDHPAHGQIFHRFRMALTLKEPRNDRSL